jgi:hypothetical protein
MGDQGREGGIGRGEVLTLLQRSARRREYELRRDGALLGWLRFPPGRRSAAEAWAGAVGSLALTAGSGRVVVRGSGDGDTLLRFTATQGLLRASVRITAQRAMPERSVELLCLLGGFLALGELQAEVDASAAVGGIVATGAG